VHFWLIYKIKHSKIYFTYNNKRAQRALGRSPEEKVNVTMEPIIENPRGII